MRGLVLVSLVFGMGFGGALVQESGAEPLIPVVDPNKSALLQDAPAQAEIAPAPAVPVVLSSLRPPARDGHLGRTRWEHQRDYILWNRAALSALKTHGKPLTDMVPADIADWCPRYPQLDDAGRRDFWVGFMSALAKHESTYRPYAVGGGGLWYGLLQILPATARGYGCHARTGEALKNGPANLSCAVRIMAVTVPRDGVIHGKDRKFRGVSADWGPMTNTNKRRDMARWLKRQPYCQPLNAVRPRLAPRQTIVPVINKDLRATQASYQAHRP